MVVALNILFKAIKIDPFVNDRELLLDLFFKQSIVTV
jgi:hypothetical protein